MPKRYCPAHGPDSEVCPRSMCDCFLDEFPDDMEAAGALHPELYTAQPPCVCEVGVQECSVHPGRLLTQEQKIAFRKAWDARVATS